MSDQEYRDYYKMPWIKNNYMNEINRSVNGANVYFMDQFDIKLKVVEISDKAWNSNDCININSIGSLLLDAREEYMWDYNKRDADAMIAFTGKDPDYEGLSISDSVAMQIPELSDPRAVEFWEPLGWWPLNFVGYLNDHLIQEEWSPRLTQHEVSHLFG
ncbi:MAG: zinc-dependent metalloprotease family protein, partial [Methanosarcinales archaeon]|nr:zinc-dependent metalloprotease family protein [Methanosarcinales archaeon]